MVSFTVNQMTGALTELPENPTINNTRATALLVDSSGKFLYALDNLNDSLIGYSIDSSTGELTLLPGNPAAVPLGPVAIAASK